VKSDQPHKQNGSTITIINGVQLEQLYSIKDLGVNFDSQLKFYKHIDVKINKAYSFLGIIKRNCTYPGKDAFITLYKALVRSQLEHVVQVWSLLTEAYIKKVEKVQMRATKLITCITHTSLMQKDLVTSTYQHCIIDVGIVCLFVALRHVSTI